jgi:hypothetical protein
MSLIGHLLMCFIPDNFSFCIAHFRRKLKAENLFDCNLEDCLLSAHQKDILKKQGLGQWNIKNSKVCEICFVSTDDLLLEGKEKII